MVSSTLLSPAVPDRAVDLADLDLHREVQAPRGLQAPPVPVAVRRLRYPLLHHRQVQRLCCLVCMFMRLMEKPRIQRRYQLQHRRALPSVADSAARLPARHRPQLAGAGSKARYSTQCRHRTIRKLHSL